MIQNKPLSPVMLRLSNLFVQLRQKIGLPGLLMLLVVVLVGCNSAIDDQIRFEQQSLAEPEGITRTDFSARILSADENDWRIGPLFVGFVNVFNPPFPNPIGNQNIRFELDVISFDAVDGLIIVTQDETGFNRTLFTFPSAPLPTGIITVQFPARLLDNTGIFTNARGIHRIWAYDRRGRLITYGDILVE